MMKIGDRMSRYAVMIVCCAISLMLVAGDGMQHEKAISADNMTAALSLDKEQIAEYMIMEGRLRELYDSIDRLTNNLLNEARMCLESREYEKAGIILQWSCKLEQMKIEESLKLQNTFTDCLSNEQKLKYFILKQESRQVSKNDTLINELHKEDK